MRCFGTESQAGYYGWGYTAGMTLALLLLLILGLGAIAFLVDRAPVIGGDFKAIVVFLLLVVAVVCVLQFFGVWAAVQNFHFGR